MSASMPVFPFALTIPSLSSFSFSSLSNSSLVSSITPTTFDAPFYYTARPNIFSSLPDKYLSILCPIITYWVVSIGFHLIDTAKFDYFEKRRIHESPEVLARNKCTVKEVVYNIMMQQLIQIVLGVLALEDDPVVAPYQHMEGMRRLAPRIADVVLLTLGRRSGEAVLKDHGKEIVQWVYWWGIPIVQFMLAFFVMDCWQYFWHRLFHTFTFLYRHIHSVHHRLYVPFAFGALYNHPVEGFIFDALGAVACQFGAGLSLRQSMLFFTFSAAKTVDDHSGYKLWWDPMQLFFYNNADYHDIHHQIYGLKKNFSQPFFTNWDIIFGTRMTREEANSRIMSRRKTQKVE